MILRSPNPSQKTRPSDNYQKKEKDKRRICLIADFAVSADHKMKIKKSKEKDKYLDLARKPSVTVIPIVNGVLGTIPKGLERRLKELEICGRIETVKTTALLRSTRILKKSPGNLRRFAVIQTPMKNHQLMLIFIFRSVLFRRNFAISSNTFSNTYMSSQMAPRTRTKRHAQLFEIKQLSKKLFKWKSPSLQQKPVQ